jgi:hypothetical protein
LRGGTAVGSGFLARRRLVAPSGSENFCEEV